ncbi:MULTISPECIES: proton-conducting transporter transmembrane domain-containing protein [unclassified Streptosporangium]|uniref:proton-conducting transporter transmembrane domain-containing protein n=1 Tax=unclassified Streptosporangium TaxID=2632669 RepID=UPI002E2D3C3E|nr:MULTISPECIES: proton-conducting transporter membrane subunit [unclassified Streptosporangium]
MSVAADRFLLIAVAGLPLGAFLLLAALALRRRGGAERIVSTVVTAAFGLATACALVLALTVTTGGDRALEVSAGAWFGEGDHRFPLVLVGDRLSLPFAALTALLVGLVGVFSRRYLHREPGYLRFYLLLALFGTGVEIVALAGGLELAFVGWELAGLASALLIAFFHERRKPVEHALRAFLTYRACDVGLPAAVVWLHRTTGGSTVTGVLHDGGWAGFEAPAAGGDAALIGILLLWAAMGKAAQVPLGGWLPRAMEGPTPSSALFYGAISVSLGPYLLLRTESVWAQAPAARTAIVAVGALTAVHVTLSGRVQTDIKSALAYASMTQIGMIMAEIGLGLRYLALAHLVAHAASRSAQILRSPSLIHDHHHLERLTGGPLPRTGRHLDRLVPRAAQAWLYRYALERGYFDAWLRDHLVGGLTRLIRRADALDDRWARRLSTGRGGRQS